MKRNCLITSSIIFVTLTNAYGQTCTNTKTRPDSSYVLSTIITGSNCKTSETIYFIVNPNYDGSGSVAFRPVQSCTSCNTGQVLTDVTYTDDGCEYSSTNIYKTCGCPSASCTNCSDSDWTPANSYHIQMRQRKTCICGTCNTIVEFRCASGYYGIASSMDDPRCNACPDNAGCPGGPNFVCVQGYYLNNNSCSRCPISSTFYAGTSGTDAAVGTTIGAGASAINECYIPGNYTLHDNIGNFQFTSSCYYNP
ncbi:MAG: hypothetical protein IJ866_02380 [Alphaproteobacteria bacterium]|nr:hypothetical protein [Alphaproteobacteria bacterium]